jgi:hypothetical protein
VREYIFYDTLSQVTTTIFLSARGGKILTIPTLALLADVPSWQMLCNARMFGGKLLVMSVRAERASLVFLALSLFAFSFTLGICFPFFFRVAFGGRLIPVERPSVFFLVFLG